MADLARQQAMEVWGAPETEPSTAAPSQSSGRRETSQNLEEDADRRSKWQKSGFKGQSGRQGKGSYHGSWKDPNDPWSYESTPLGEAEKELLRNMAKMLMRHESEMRLLRQDNTWMAFVDTSETGILALIQQKAEAWQKLYLEKKVTSSLRVVLVIVVFQELLTRINALQQDQERLTRMHTVGWLVEGSQAINPCWTYQQWSHENQKVETSSQTPIPFTAVQDALQTIINNIGGPGVLLRFRATRPLTEKISSEVLPFVLVLSLRGQQAAQVHQALYVSSVDAPVSQWPACVSVRIGANSRRWPKLWRPPTPAFPSRTGSPGRSNGSSRNGRSPRRRRKLRTRSSKATQAGCPALPTSLHCPTPRLPAKPT